MALLIISGVVRVRVLYSLHWWRIVEAWVAPIDAAHLVDAARVAMAISY